MLYQPRKFKKGDPIRASDLDAMDKEIVRLGKVSTSGGITHDNGPGGLSLSLKQPPGLQRAVVTTAIPAASGANNVSNTGRATLRVRTGTTLADGATGQIVYSDFSVAIPVGTRIIVAPDSDGWMLVAVDYCPL
jgi:hypothetical protein